MKTRLALIALLALLGVSRPVPALAESSQAEAGFVVRWEAAALPVFNGSEIANPWGHRTPDEADPRWQVYETSPDGSSHLLYETPRVLNQLNWDAHGKSFRVRQVSFGEPTGSPDNREEAILYGFVRLSQGPMIDDDILFQGTQPVVSPDGRSVAVAKGTDIFIRQLGMPDRKLSAEGRTLQVLSWAPDGSAVLMVDIASPKSNSGAAYLVPTTTGAARYVFHHREYARTTWSHEGSRLAYLEDGYLLIYDRASHTSTRLASGYDVTTSIEWSADDSFLVVGADLFNARTGALIVRLLEPDSKLSHFLSKDNRYFIATDQPGGPNPGRNHCDRPPLENRTYIFDLWTGAKRALHDCDGTFLRAGPGTLIDGSGVQRAIMHEHSCYNCDGGSSTVHAMSLDGATSVNLGKGGAVVSPDSQKLLIGGATLKLYSSDLDLLKEYPVPAGKIVYAIAWSPDSKRFVFVLGPAVFNQL